jgi:hypothetical protein
MEEAGISNPNHLNSTIRETGQGEGMLRKHNLAKVNPTVVQATASSVWKNKVRHNLF